MKNNITRRINILRDSVARRIAAGEVIDRPQAVVRELLDNSIDAEASEISLHIRNGGIDELRVVDNGVGMDADDLRKCFLPHATSKIAEFEDIYSTHTLGFRGEALSSIAACSKLTIISSDGEDSPANRLEITDGSLRDFSEYRGSRGTVVSVRDLFYSMPGRRNFLKSASAESGQCRSMFIEKALPQNKISFRYFVDDKLRLFLPASDRRDRVISSYGSLFRPEFLKAFETESDGLKISAVLGSPSLYRKDRKYIHIFINNRRINDYSLVQAVDYAYSSYLPGGCHPVCFLFLDIPPAHVDFNIHPAKREIKFRNLPTVHHSVTEEIGRFLSGNNSFAAEIPSQSRRSGGNMPEEAAEPARLPGLSFSSGGRQDSGKISDGSEKPPRPSLNTVGRPQAPAADSIFRKMPIDTIASELKPSAPPVTDEPAPSIVFLGQIFRLFLVFEQGDRLILIDQHAAHERIIFERLSSGRPEVQELLIPLELSLEREEESVFERNIDEYRTLGFDLQRKEQGKWLINAMPSVCSGMEEQLSSFFRGRHSSAAELKKELYAMISCRTAIKDGDTIDAVRALEIAGRVLDMDNPRCPHGRPVIQLFSREQLFRMFGRTF